MAALGMLGLAVVGVLAQGRRSRQHGDQLARIEGSVNHVPDLVTGEPGPPLWKRLDDLHDLVVIHLADRDAPNHTTSHEVVQVAEAST